jgi:hypothetical protein
MREFGYLVIPPRLLCRGYNLTQEASSVTASVREISRRARSGKAHPRTRMVTRNLQLLHSSRGDVIQP